MAVNAQTGELQWRVGRFTGIASKADAIERVTHVSMALGGDHVALIEDDAIVALDLETGQRRWTVKRPTRKRPVTYGHYYFTNLCSLVCQDDMVFFSEPDPTITRQPWNAPVKTLLSAISAETGRTLWTRECGMWGHYSQGDIFVIDGLVWIYDHPDFSMVGLDPETGEVKRTLAAQEALDQGHHHRCYRNKATPRYILTSRRGVEFIDVESEENHRHHWFRGACRYGIMPCNGLLYVPPHPCVCYITAKLNGFWALAPERSGKAEVAWNREDASRTKEDGEQAGRFEVGPAYGTSAGSRPALRDSSAPSIPSWATYRGDNARSGSAAAAVEHALRVAWSRQVGPALTSPVVSAARVYLASTETHSVSAVDAERGTTIWSYTAGGPVDTPPTVYRGFALFGCADGWVYCLRAADGQLAWRRRVAPEDTQLMNNGQLESPWPVHGSVLVQDDVAYFAAGRSSFLDGGIAICAVDPLTGALRRQEVIDSRDPGTGDMVEARLPYDMPPDDLGALPDILVGDGTRVYMRHLSFDPSDLQFRSAADAAKKNRREFPYVGGHLMSVAGMLDDSWFNQTYWTVDGRGHSKLLVFDADAAYGVKPFPGDARHSRAIFRPGAKGYTLFANERPSHNSRWSIQVPVRITAMVVAGQTLFVAGTPDTVDPDDPWSAIEGRAGGVLWAISTTDGNKLAEYDLESPPRFDGMAAADGRLYLSCIDGRLVCYGSEP
jgi:outer membrane protein assembly factor BamB